MRILFVGHSPHLAGAEYSLLRLIRRLRGEVEATVAAPGGGVFEREIRALGLPFHAFFPLYPFRHVRGRGPVAAEFLARLSANVARLERELAPPDLVHANTFFAWEGALLAARWGRPCAWNLREFADRSPTWTPLLGYAPQLGLMDRLADRFVCVSGALAASLAGVDPAKVDVAVNGLDAGDLAGRAEARAFLEQACGVPRDAVVLLTVGNFIPEKGHDFLARAAAAILAANPQARFLWVGRHDFHYAEARRILAASGMESAVIAPGHLEGFGRVMRGADLYILPSLVDACPTVVLEALAAGLPVVARDSGGARELLAPGGGVVLGEDTPEALAAAVNDLLAGRLAPPPAPAASPFTMERMAAAYLACYRKAAAGYRPSPERAALAEGLIALGRDLAGTVADVERVRSFQRGPVVSRLLRLARRLGLAGPGPFMP